MCQPNPVTAYPKILDDVLEMIAYGWKSSAAYHLNGWIADRQPCLHVSVWDQIEVLREWCREK